MRSLKREWVRVENVLLYYVIPAESGNIGAHGKINVVLPQELYPTGVEAFTDLQEPIPGMYTHYLHFHKEKVCFL